MTVELWDEQLENEPIKAYSYFLTYVGLGLNRSLRKVQQEHNGDISLVQLKKYSSKYHWVPRAKLKDKEDLLKKKGFLKETEFLDGDVGSGTGSGNENKNNFQRVLDNRRVIAILQKQIDDLEDENRELMDSIG